jgi:hypothetical protein
MVYTAVIKRNPNHTPDIEVIRNIQTWQQVVYLLRHKLDSFVICVEVKKWSSDGRLLGHVSVTMSNMCDVCLSLRDTVLTNK